MRLVEEFVAGLTAEGLEVARVEPGSVATTRSSSPLAISDSAFLALRMGSGQLRPRVSSSRCTSMRARPSFVRSVGGGEVEPLGLDAALAQPRGHGLARALRPAFDLTRAQQLVFGQLRREADLAVRLRRVGNDDLVEALELPNA